LEKIIDMKNFDLKENKITTIAGVIFLLISILMYVMPMFFEVKKDFTEKWYVPLIPMAIGVLLMRSPDTIVKGTGKAINKLTKTDKGNDQ
jgi:hypothetical protein